VSCFGVAAYLLVSKGALTLDVGVGRRTRPLGPIRLDIAASPQVVFDIIASPYLDRTPRAMQAKLRVLERGSDMVLAAHFTDVGWGLTTSTVEVVRFERPSRVTFHLVRGPVPHVTEAFELAANGAGTAFTYTGEIGADFWRLGAWWANKVAGRWESTVARTLADVQAEAERRAGVAAASAS
jgi:hypothetical protein